MKKLINDPRQAVREMLEGTMLVSPRLALLEHENVVVRADVAVDPAQRPVALISGGGSGHEPAHVGYIGEGMLSAAVVGDVFTSPSVDAVLAAIDAAAGPAGALLIVKNYTGDRLNFGLAAEISRRGGVPVEIVVVADDVALRDTVAPDRRRGVAGTILVHKIAGAAVAQGLPLCDIAALARVAADSIATMSVGLGSCIVPSAGVPGFELGPDEIEFGLGIHGEKGVRRASMASANFIVDALITPILADLQLPAGANVALLVNGLGATTPMELAIVTRHAIATLRATGIAVTRAWSGAFMTALEMPGFSLSLLPLDGRLTELLDFPATAAAWPGPGIVMAKPAIIRAATAALEPEPPITDGPISAQLRRAVSAVATALMAAEAQLAELDRRAGDGDLGASMARGAEALRALPAACYSDPETLLVAAANSLRRAIAGSSGPFYATALMRAAQEVAGAPLPSSDQWRLALNAGLNAIREIGGAAPGDRTMLDALAPAAEAWAQQGWAAVAQAAAAGAEATAAMHPRMGRASYLGERALGVPDGGAVAVAIWLEAISGAIRHH